MTRLFPRLLFALLAALVAAIAASAQTVRWDPPSGSLAVGQPAELSLIFDDCEPTSGVTLPPVADLKVGQLSVSTQTSIVNFRSSTRTIVTYPVIALKKGRLEIPGFEVQTDKGKLRVPTAVYEGGDATVGRSNLSIDDVATAEITTGRDSVWAGEVFPLEYQLSITRRFNPSGVDAVEWQPPPELVVEPWTKPENFATGSGAAAKVGLTTRTRGSIREPGTVTLPPSRQMIALEVGAQPFGFFSRPNVEQYLITGKAPTLRVKPLPQPAPPSFRGAVGQFTFESKVVPAAATVGEPVTWTLTLKGTGNWTEGLALPAREASRDFQVIRPQTQRTVKEGTLFEGSLVEDVVLVPTKAGSYTLGPVRFTYFDPATGTYQTVTGDAVHVTVKPAGAAKGSLFTPPDAEPAAPPAAEQYAPDASLRKAPAPTPPGRLPREPLAGTGWAPRPFRHLAWWIFLTPLAPFVVVALGLGFRRAALTDPLRARREARAALPRCLAAVRAATGTATLPLAIREWRRLTAALWGIDAGEPGAADLAAAIHRRQPAAKPDLADTWTRLWRETDAFLYARAQPLPADWPARAEQALAAVRLQRPAWHAPLWRSNLWPVLALAALAMTAPRADAAPSAPDEAYRRGEFSVAEKAWAAGLAANPADWKARHNLGLALAQQNRWSEAAAQWGAAFLAAPRAESVRWHFELGLQKAEFTQPELAAFANGDLLPRAARIASPAEWQLGRIAAAGLGGLAALLVLGNRHFRRRPWINVVALLLVLGGTLLFAASVVALRVYGPLGHPDAALVVKATVLRSIPTEAGDQKTEPLSAGSLVLADPARTFLGWQQIAFPNGQTGWIRREQLVPLHR